MNPITASSWKTAEIPPLEEPSFIVQALSEKVAKSLMVSRQQTLDESQTLFSGLDSMRKFLIEGFDAREIALPIATSGIRINGLHFPGTQKTGIIYLHGNGGFYETSFERPLSWIEGLKESSPDNSAPHLMVCNPGGTGRSGGYPHPDTVARELLAQFEFLVNVHGIDPNDIVVAGHSMGGFFGAFGAALIQQRYPNSAVNFISDRSFASIYSRVAAKTENPERFAVVNFLERHTLEPLISITHWDRDPVAAIETLKGRVCIVYHERDGVVSYPTSTHKALAEKADRSRNYSCLSMNEEAMAEISGSTAHNRGFNEEEHKKLIAELKKMLRLPLTEEEQRSTLDSL